MKRVTIQVPSVEKQSYDLFVGSGIFGHFAEIIATLSPSRVMMICDAEVRKVSPQLQNISYPLFEISERGEQQKTVSVLESLWEAMLHHKLDRNAVVFAVGGGATCDVVGFAAATFMRGIRLVNVPTTLLSQVDSSIGGKTAINLGKVKNIPGAFSHPSAVLIDVEFLKTLPHNEFASGCAELIKHGVIADEALFRRMGETALSSAQQELLAETIIRSLDIKRRVVESDPFERGLRKTLNFGHTIGHAYEAYSHTTQNPLLHGEAVAIGMVLETKLALQQGVLKIDILKDLERALEKQGLPVKAPPYDVEAILSFIAADKKNRGDTLLFALPSGIGRCDFDVKVTSDEIRKILV